MKRQHCIFCLGQQGHFYGSYLLLNLQKTLRLCISLYLWSVVSQHHLNSVLLQLSLPWIVLHSLPQTMVDFPQTMVDSPRIIMVDLDYGVVWCNYLFFSGSISLTLIVENYSEYFSLHLRQWLHFLAQIYYLELWYSLLCMILSWIPYCTVVQIT